MHTGLMLLCDGLLLHDHRPWRLLLYLELIVVLVIKGRYAGMRSSCWCGSCLATRTIADESERSCPGLESR